MGRHISFNTSSIGPDEKELLASWMKEWSKDSDDEWMQRASDVVMNSAVALDKDDTFYIFPNHEVNTFFNMKKNGITALKTWCEEEGENDADDLYIVCQRTNNSMVTFYMVNGKSFKKYIIDIISGDNTKAMLDLLV